MPNLINFEWRRCLDGYEVVDHGPFQETDPDQNDGVWIYAKSTRIEAYYPLEEHKALFREFAGLNPKPSHVADFASNYGLLNLEYESPIFEWDTEIQNMARAVAQWEQGDFAALIDDFNFLHKAELRTELKMSPGAERPRLEITPRTLLQTMWLQFGQVVTANTQLRRCAQCPTWFAFGSGTGHRKSAHYCSDKCRKAAFVQRKGAKQ